MKRILKLGIKGLAVTLALAGGMAVGQPAADEVRQLIGRVTPAVADRFELETIPAAEGLDVFEIQSKDGKVVLRGNNGISLASAYNRYLQDHCKCLYSLWGDQMKLPDPLPSVTGTVRVVTPRKIRHFFNYCTFNYSGSWWDWKDWEKIIDWMAMNGINMPLNIVGTEAVWYHTLRELGLNDEEARKCLPAPVYFNWQWMGNLEGTGGPLPLGWIESHEKLGRRVMEREQALGMTPILHGFSGVVPRVFKTKFPDARIDMKPSWGRGTFVGTATLDPMDPLFGKVAKTYLSQLVQRMGTSHLYITDPFHESAPPIQGVEYLQNVAKSIDKILLEVDPKAVWICQDWSLYPDIIRSIPKDRLIIMSLTGGKMDEYKDWGYRYTVGQLNSFGGETHLHGPLVQEQKNGVALAMKASPNCVGSGNWMEGLENSPSYYHFMLDLNWEAGEVDLQKRLSAYCERRYGGITDNIRKMNQLLAESVYLRGGHGFSSVVAARPAVFPIKSSPGKELEIVKDAFDKHVQAWEALLADRERFGASPGYQYDVVDLGRQVLSYLAIYCQRDTAIYLHRKDLEGFRKSRDRFLQVIDDMDELLGTSDHFLFGKWVDDARHWGTTPEESAYYAKYATMLVTLWGHDNPDYPVPNWQDYAWREWNGLVKHYYRKRWEIFYNEIESRLEQCIVFEDVIRDKWARPLTSADKSGLYEKLYLFESTFGEHLPEMKSKATGDPMETAWRIFSKYKADMDKLPPAGPVLAPLFEPTEYKDGSGAPQRSIRIKPDVLKEVLQSEPYFGR